MNFLLTTLAARQCLTFNPPSDDQFDSALLSAPVLLQCLSREQIAKSAEDKLKELTSSARSMTEVLIQAESSNISLSSRLSGIPKRERQSPSRLR